VRVAVTGVGVVCALGGSLAEAWPRIVAGERAAAELRLFDTTGQRATLAAQVDRLTVPSRADGHPWSRTDAMALQAAEEALAEAGLSQRTPGLRLGVVLGGTTGGMFETERRLAQMSIDASTRVPDPDMLAHPLSATMDRLAETLGPLTRARTLCSACSSGANAFVLGAAWLALDLVDVVLAGGTDALCRLTFTGFNALGAIDPAPARPFDVRRRGLTIGEGAGFAVLERPSRARARGVGWGAELVGYGALSEAHHITNPEASGEIPARAILAALARAGVSPREVDYVNAHGTATQLNDAMETRALVRALGDEISRVRVSSTKGQIGHTLGAAGAIEAALTARVVQLGVIPPTGGLEQIDPECAALRHVVGAAERAEVRVALSSSFGFGGVDTVLAFAKPGFAGSEDDARVRRPVRVTAIGTATKAGARAGEANADLLEPVAARDPAELAIQLSADPVAGLDVARARRLDRASRLAAVAIGLVGAQPDDAVLLGVSYGETDGSAAFLARTFEKGPRLAPPAEFPNLVPSAPSGHVSIYHRLHGLASTVADLGASGEAALATAYELMAAGELDAAIVGTAEAPSELVATSLAPTFAEVGATASATSAARGEGGAAARLVSGPAGEAGGVGPLVLAVAQAEHAADALRDPEIQALAGGAALVVVADATAALCATIAASGWREATLLRVLPALGTHEGLGGVAIAGAVARLGRGEAERALVIGEARGRAYAVVIGRG
jgi:3-oxoacyl-[acyl-carrier-protein] synthase II